MTTWRKGTRGGRKTFARVEALPRGRTLFVDCYEGTWRAYSARDGLDAPSALASADDTAWCNETVFVASGGAGSCYFDAW